MLVLLCSGIALWLQADFTVLKFPVFVSTGLNLTDFCLLTTGVSQSHHQVAAEALPQRDKTLAASD